MNINVSRGLGMPTYCLDTEVQHPSASIHHMPGDEPSATLVTTSSTVLDLLTEREILDGPA